MRATTRGEVAGTVAIIAVAALLLLIAIANIAERSRIVDGCIAAGMVPVAKEGELGCIPADERLLGRGVDNPGKMP